MSVPTSKYATRHLRARPVSNFIVPVSNFIVPVSDFIVLCRTLLFVHTKMAEYVILIWFQGQNKHKSNDDNTSYHRRVVTGLRVFPAEFFNAAAAGGCSAHSLLGHQWTSMLRFPLLSRCAVQFGDLLCCTLISLKRASAIGGGPPWPAAAHRNFLASDLRTCQLRPEPSG